MAALRRSSRRQAQSRPTYDVASDDDRSATDDEADDGSASADEWRPIDKKEREKGRRNGRRRIVEDASSDDDDEVDDDVDEDELLEAGGGKGQRKRRSMETSKEKETTKKIKIVSSLPTTTTRIVSPSKAVVQKPTSATVARPAGLQNRPASGLDQWLGVDPPAWPSTCAEAMITDRDSLFVGFVYTLNAPSQAEITQCLSHLTKVVHPQLVPTDKLPPAMQHLAPSRRGATHDMYAWRSLALKKGRNGLGGPDDFGVEEGQEDDGERFGAKEIAKAIRTFGATDVLVVVSRWYGGTMLGPVRFRHIEESAKAALARFMVDEAMVELRGELRTLDEQIEILRRSSQTSQPVSHPSTNTAVRPKNDYANLDPDRAQRLIMARKRQIELLKRPKQASQPSETAAITTDPGYSAERPSVDPSEEEAALQALREMEERIPTQPEASSGDLNTVVKKEVDPPIEKATEQIVKVKVEPMDEIAVEKQIAKEKAGLLAMDPVKEEENEADLTGWDEL